MGETGLVPRGDGVLAFLGESLASLRRRRLAVPVALLSVLLTASNIVILQNLPVTGEPPQTAFAAAALVRLLGLLVLAVAILRVLAASERPAWKPDAGFWLYALTVLAGIGLSIGLERIVGARDELVSSALIGLGVALISAPFAPWFTALAVERPLALNPAPWFRRFGDWLPALVLWSLLIVVPLGQLHARIDMYLLRGAGEWFWPLALFDGVLSAFLALLGLAFAATAYRRVARG